MGYEKLVESEDERHAAVAGLQAEFLMQPSIEMHLGDGGDDPESASHTLSTS